jgi:hypothetical protein
MVVFSCLLYGSHNDSILGNLDSSQQSHLQQQCRFHLVDGKQNLEIFCCFVNIELSLVLRRIWLHGCLLCKFLVHNCFVFFSIKVQQGNSPPVSAKKTPLAKRK